MIELEPEIKKDAAWGCYGSHGPRKHIGFECLIRMWVFGSYIKNEPPGKKGK